ncbi:MAG: integrase [Spartobacteria bacterium]|nr:integrase [Spartobacteria bacterium]
MPNELLTPDNLLLSRPKNQLLFSIRADLHLMSLQLDQRVSALVDASLSDNSRRAYLSDLAHFESWGGVIPASDRMVATYLASHAATHSVATLVRRIASISKTHEAQALPNPTRSELVRATIRGIRRTRGTRQHQAKPLLKEDLFAVLDAMGDTPKDARDRALLLVGFAGGFRRSELVALNVADIERVQQGITVQLRRSKTDQCGDGRKIGIPSGRSRWCPVAALEVWLLRSGITAGPIFRPVDRHSNISADRLSGEAVSLVVRSLVQTVGIDHSPYSAHSLRAGLATSAAQAGVPTEKIRAQTGHASDAMLSRYIRDGQLFTDNASGALL